jgi:dTMP kinase
VGACDQITGDRLDRNVFKFFQLFGSINCLIVDVDESRLRRRIQDRYLDSSVAYQGAGRVLDPVEVRNLSLWATEGLLPDVTVLLDLDPAIGRERLDAENKRFDRLESEALEFHTRVRDSYLELAAAEPDRFIVVDARLDRDVIRDAIRARLNERS